MHGNYTSPRSDQLTNVGTAGATSKAKRYRAIKDHLFSSLVDEAVILSLENGRYYGLNHVGAAIWSSLQQPVTLSEIESFLMKEYEVDEQTCRIEVMSLLKA
jgi:hypothetical protein